MRKFVLVFLSGVLIAQGCAAVLGHAAERVDLRHRQVACVTDGGQWANGRCTLNRP